MLMLSKNSTVCIYVLLEHVKQDTYTVGPKYYGHTIFMCCEFKFT